MPDESNFKKKRRACFGSQLEDTVHSNRKTWQQELEEANHMYLQRQGTGEQVRLVGKGRIEGKLERNGCTNSK